MRSKNMMKPLATTGLVSGGARWAQHHFRSPAVRSWRPSKVPGAQAGSLHARVAGDASRAVVLLHGLVSTGDVFGAAFDGLARTRRLVVPDLLGFGRSLHDTRLAFSVESHLLALDELAELSGLFDRRWTIGAHSMGSALALHWALRHRDRVERVVCWGAPVYQSSDIVRARIAESVMSRLFTLDTKWAERACAVSCRHRTAAGWLAAAAEPTLPVPVARAASHHTWPAYRDAMRHLVIETDWSQLLDEVQQAGVDVELVWGVDDPVGDRDYAQSITSGMSASTIRVALVPGADHHIPMTHPAICLSHLR